MTEVRLTLSLAIDHPSLAGHFPGQPIVPGVVLLDMVVSALEQHGMLKTDFLTSSSFEILACKFLAPVLPGANLSLTLRFDKENRTVSFRLEQADQTMASGSIKVAPLHDDSII
jgi:3-hydroxyacyl-[acyl-carrier-protein] dehydratase